MKGLETLDLLHGKGLAGVRTRSREFAEHFSLQRHRVGRANDSEPERTASAAIAAIAILARSPASADPSPRDRRSALLATTAARLLAGARSPTRGRAPPLRGPELLRLCGRVMRARLRFRGIAPWPTRSPHRSSPEQHPGARRLSRRPRALRPSPHWRSPAPASRDHRAARRTRRGRLHAARGSRPTSLRNAGQARAAYRDPAGLPGR